MKYSSNHSLFKANTIFCFVFALFVIHNSKAQTGYSHGYIVMPTGDTLTGFVQNYKGVQGFRSVKFKKIPKAQAETYFPDQIKAYGFDNGIRFESAKVRDYDLVNKVTTERMRFLEVLNKGTLDLYYLNVSRKRFFVGRRRQFY